MITHFIEMDINLRQAGTGLVQFVEAELRRHGHPLRWAIVSVDRNTQTACIEAVVTVESSSD